MSELQREYDKGTNLIQYIRTETGQKDVSARIILKSYDIQAGSYIASLSEPGVPTFQKERAEDIVTNLKGLKFDSLVEAGCGEATTLVYLLNALTSRPSRIAGFDISWSRIKFARHHATDNGILGNFFMGEMTHIPLPSNSYDMVFTSHAIEPNRGTEREILAEIHRVSSRYAALVEPCYELATSEMREHMDTHRYCKDLAHHAEAAGFTILKHHLLEKTNKGRTMILLLEKDLSDNTAVEEFACPQCATELTPHAGHLYCKECMTMYPIIDSIPCLRKENGIIASKFLNNPV
nr:methyltransferase domain-containing protein [uncultured Pseudodesulfovibrio sp.]